eukprot:Nk52_evm118s352 gene=Nk52_evmTU118s352
MSTEHSYGYDSLSKPSSRVLAAPGGGSSISFGCDDSNNGDSDLISRRERARRFNSSNIFDATPAPQEEFHPQRKMGKPHSKNDIFGETNQPSATPSDSKKYGYEQTQSSIFKEESCESMDSPHGGKRHLVNPNAESQPMFEPETQPSYRAQIKVSPQKPSEIFEPLPDKDYSKRVMDLGTPSKPNILSFGDQESVPCVENNLETSETNAPFATIPNEAVKLATEHKNELPAPSTSHFNAQDEVERLTKKFEKQMDSTNFENDVPGTPMKAAPYATSNIAGAYERAEVNKIDYASEASAQRDAITMARNNRQHNIGSSPIAHKEYSNYSRSKEQITSSPSATSSSCPWAVDESNNVPFKRDSSKTYPSQEQATGSPSRAPSSRRPPGGFSSFTLG